MNNSTDVEEFCICEDPQRFCAHCVKFFSAGILQPGDFDNEGDSVSNYGSAGAGMAHEISHCFDALGNIHDAKGCLEGW